MFCINEASAKKLIRTGVKFLCAHRATNAVYVLSEGGAWNIYKTYNSLRELREELDKLNKRHDVIEVSTTINSVNSTINKWGQQ